MKKTVIFAVVILFACVCNVNAAIALWDWEENFDDGLSGWVSEVPNAWQAVGGDLVYFDLIGTGQRAIRHPDSFPLSNGFRMEIELNSTNVKSADRLGILFGSTAAMIPNYEFSLKEQQTGETGPKWYLYYHLSFTNYFNNLGDGYTDSYSGQPHLIRIEYDGTELSCFVEDSEVTTKTVVIPDGYVGIYCWDSGDNASTATIENVRFAAVPEPVTITLLAVGSLLLLRRRK